MTDFLADDVDESLHDFIRTNVLTAVLNFNQRFTAFKKEIMFGENNPMEIEYLEFAMRGAAHIHGTLWLDLNKLDPENRNEQTVDENIEEEADELIDTSKYKFPGIKKIFNKIRRNEDYISFSPVLLS